MFKSFVIIVFIGLVSFIYSELGNKNALYGIIMPVAFFFSLISLAIWFVILFHKNNIEQTASSGYCDSGPFDGGSGGGGDC